MPAIPQERTNRGGRGQRDSFTVGYQKKGLLYGQRRVLVLAIAAAVLIWLVVTRSLVLYLADAAPKAALWFNPRQPQALINMSVQKLNADLHPTDASRDVASTGAGAGTADDSGPQIAKAEGAPDNNKKAADSLGTPGEGDKIKSAFESFGRYQTVDLAAIRSDAKTALDSDPLNPSALTLLGQAADAAGDDVEATKFMQAAAQLSLHDTIAQFWLMRKATAAGDYKSATGYADVLLRTNLSLSAYVVPYLAHFADNSATSGPVQALIKGNPPWRRIFFAQLPPSVSDVRTPLALLLSLKNTNFPPTNEELGDYLNYLVAHRFYSLAYYAWLQFLPAVELQHVGLLFNGDFAITPSGFPFDWQITQGSGVAVDIEQDDKNDQRFLTVDFLYGRVDYHSVSELVMLTPGRYRFAGKYKGELIGPRGLKWRIACADDPGAPIAESAMIGGEVQTWSDINFDFTIPETKCAAQLVRLDLDARMASEQLVSGSMQFTGLSIARSDADADDSNAEDGDPDTADPAKPVPATTKKANP